MRKSTQVRLRTQDSEKAFKLFMLVQRDKTERMNRYKEFLANSKGFPRTRPKEQGKQGLGASNRST